MFYVYVCCRPLACSQLTAGHNICCCAQQCQAVAIFVLCQCVMNVGYDHVLCMLSGAMCCCSVLYTGLIALGAGAVIDTVQCRRFIHICLARRGRHVPTKQCMLCLHDICIRSTANAHRVCQDCPPMSTAVRQAWRKLPCQAGRRA